MFGLHSGRNGVGSVLILSGLVTAMLSGPVSADGSSVKSGKGSGGSENAVASDHVVPTGKERMTIVISDDRPPAFVQAKDGADTTTSIKQVFGNGDLLSIKRDVELAQQGAAPANDDVKVRFVPPTAIDLLGHRDEPQAKTAVAVLPSVSPPVQTPAARPQSGRIEQAQFVPGALGVAKSIMPPRTAEEAEVGQGQSSVFLPSPRKPDVPMGATQEVALVPHVGEAPKAAALRQAPSPDNQLVESVETPSDQALKLSAGRGQLLSLGTAVTDIFVADPGIADVKVVSPQKLFVHGNQLGRTNIFGIGSNGDIVFGLDLQVVPDADVAQAQLKALSPNGDTNIQLVSDQLVAGGTVNDVGEALQVAALSDQLTATEGPTANNTVISGSQQVNLRVRFAEVTRDDVVNLGVNWNALGNTGDFLIGLSNGPDVGDVASLAGSLAGDSSTSGGIPGTGDINVEAFIDALHQEGIISLLAEPNLTAINGETGQFLAGSEIPILVPGGGGDGTTTIEYKQVGVSLEYVPTLLPGNRINLRIRPEVSSPSAAGGVVINGFSIPAFTVRRTDTSVELASGQTMALAGLFQRDVSTDVNKFPVLGDLPILGKLFRSERYQRSETELVILITPYLVEPTNNPNIALPNERIDAQRKPLAQQTQRRRAGFIVN